MSKATKSEAQNRSVQIGDRVHVVTPNDGHLAADVVYVDARGKIKVEFEHRGSVVAISSVPYDPSAQQPDSWHWPEPE